jgi:hypothetical protein
MLEEPNCGRPEAADAIWSWQEVGNTRSDDEARARARRKGVIQGIVAIIVATLFFLFWSRTVAGIVYTIGAVTLFAALVSPLGLYAAIESLIVRLGMLLGVLTTWLMLVPTFYLIFLPFGILFRRGRRDRMRRFYEPDAPTYWTVREEKSLEPSSWANQY